MKRIWLDNSHFQIGTQHLNFHPLKLRPPPGAFAAHSPRSQPLLPNGFCFSYRIPNFRATSANKTWCHHYASSEFLHTPPFSVPLFPARPARPPAAQAWGSPLRPWPSFPRPGETAAALDPGLSPSSSAIVSGEVGAPARPGISRPPGRRTPRSPSTHSRPPRPHFLTRPPAVCPPTAFPRAAREPECRERRAAGGLDCCAWACAGRKVTRRSGTAHGRRCPPALGTRRLVGPAAVPAPDVLTKKVGAHACFP